MKLRHLGLALRLAGPRAMAALAFVSLAVAGEREVGLAVSGVALAFTWWAVRRQWAPTGAVEYTVVAAGLLAAYARDTVGPTVGLVLIGAMSLLLLLDDVVLSKIADGAGDRIVTANFPEVDRGRLADRAPATHANAFLVAAVWVTTALALPTWSMAAAATVVAAMHVASAMEALVRIRRGDTSLERLRSGLLARRPAFLVHFSAPAGSEYQVTTWLPYLERIGLPFAIVLREQGPLPAIAAATRSPVVVCPTLGSLDYVVSPTVRTVFYVNNGMKNTHLVRFTHLTHVQLLHGDSEKAPSYNPVTAMYDKVFVAGQAGIDRYADHGVTIPAAKFRIVGRPQVESIRIAAQPVRDLGEKVVLYAPTWVGHDADANFCSLPVAAPLVAKLLEHKATVILRPHPYSMHHRESALHIAALERMLADDRRLTGRAHRWGAAVLPGMSLVDCFNEANALVTDVSSVANDFLYSEKPFAIVDMSRERAGDFLVTMPLAKVAYVIRPDLENVEEVICQLLESDPREEVRRTAKTYYLGPFPAESYADAFVRAAREQV